MQRHIGFGRVKATDIACQRHNLNAVEGAISWVVADDDGGPGLADFPADRRIEGDPPYFTALWAAASYSGLGHELCRRSDLSTHSAASRSRS